PRSAIRNPQSAAAAPRVAGGPAEAVSMQFETTNGHKSARIGWREQRVLRSACPPFNERLRRERQAISGASSLVFISVHSWLKCTVTAEASAAPARRKNGTAPRPGAALRPGTRDPELACRPVRLCLQCLRTRAVNQRSARKW